MYKRYFDGTALYQSIANAEVFDGEFDVVLVHELGAPGDPELTIGAVSERGEGLLNEDARAASVPQGHVNR